MSPGVIGVLCVARGDSRRPQEPPMVGVKVLESRVSACSAPSDRKTRDFGQMKIFQGRDGLH